MPLSSKVKVSLVVLLLIVGTAGGLAAYYVHSQAQIARKDLAEMVERQDQDLELHKRIMDTRGKVRNTAFDATRFRVSERQLPNDLHEMLEYSKAENSYLRGRTEKNYEDAWGQPLRYETTVTEGKKAIMVWSKGQNGVDEHGEGDDIAFTLTLE